ncbi:MAG: AI-2E family transporter [Acholeplasma sp.]|nr:AI-2E family transporter [Acholeplasma sp.]
MRKFLKVLLAIVLVLTSLILLNILNSQYPGNIINRILQGLSVVLTPVLIALVLMYLVNPFTQRLIKKKKWKKKNAIFATVSLLIVIILAILGFVVWFVIDQGIALYHEITDPNFLNNIHAWFDNNDLSAVYDWLKKLIDTFDASSLIGSAGSIVSGLLQLLTSIILVPIFLWHFLDSQEVVLDKINDNLPAKWRKNIVPLLEDSNSIIVSYFRSKIISMIVLFAMFFVLYIILGIPIGYAILFSLLISLLDLIPYLGPTVGMLIPIAYIFSAGGINFFYNSNLHVNGLVANIILMGINMIIQFVQGNIIIPRLAGKEMHINSALILVFMLFFGYILGIWGIVLSIPLGGILIVVWDNLKKTGFFKND